MSTQTKTSKPETLISEVKAPSTNSAASAIIAKVMAHRDNIMAHPQVPQASKTPEKVLSRISKRLNSEGVPSPEGTPYWTRIILADYLAKFGADLTS